MILDTMDRLRLYRGLSPNLDFAIDSLQHLALDRMDIGEHDLLGDRVRLRLTETTLGETSLWEAHQKHIDLQLILKNRETICWAPVESIAGFGEYRGGLDVMTSDDPQPGTALALRPGMFAIFFPEDAHRPGLGAGTGRKAVIKIRVEDEPPPTHPPSQLTHLGTKRLQSDRLVLRPYKMEDAQDIYDHWASDDAVTRTLTFKTHPHVDVTRRILMEWINSYQSGQSYHWGIERNGELIGDIALMKWSDKQLDGEIGYCLSKKHWGQGIMTEALKRVLLFLFTELGFRRIVLKHDAQNPASGRVMQKAGLLMEGCERQALQRKNGEYGDIILYAALRDEWLKKQEDQGI